MVESSWKTQDDDEILLARGTPETPVRIMLWHDRSYHNDGFFFKTVTEVETTQAYLERISAMCCVTQVTIGSEYRQLLVFSHFPVELLSGDWAAMSSSWGYNNRTGHFCRSLCFFRPRHTTIKVERTFRPVIRFSSHSFCIHSLSLVQELFVSFIYLVVCFLSLRLSL